MPHGLIIVNMEAYGFQMVALKLVYDYLSNRIQRAKINKAVSAWKDVEYVGPQGSILGPLLCNIHFCDLLCSSLKIWILHVMQIMLQYIVQKKPKSLVNILETSSLLLFKWFNINFMKGNSDNSHLLLNCG